jgi:hypothetical protein
MGTWRERVGLYRGKGERPMSWYFHLTLEAAFGLFFIAWLFVVVLVVEGITYLRAKWAIEVDEFEYLID